MGQQEYFRQQLMHRLQRAVSALPPEVVEKYADGQFIQFRCHSEFRAPAVSTMKPHESEDLRKQFRDVLAHLPQSSIEAFFEEAREIIIKMQRDRPPIIVIGDAPNPWTPGRENQPPIESKA